MRSIVMRRLEAVSAPIRLIGRRWLWLLAWVCLLPACPLAEGTESPASLEYRVKAGYLYNFAKFVEWPAGSLVKPDSPFVIGVLDGGEAVPILQAVLAGKSVDGHPVVVRPATSGRGDQGFQILFVTRAAGKAPRELGALAGSRGTLVVGEADKFVEEGGMVGFTREADRIRFSLSIERATAAGLKVSSKLASVARLVHS